MAFVRSEIIDILKVSNTEGIYCAKNGGSW